MMLNYRVRETAADDCRRTIARLSDAATQKAWEPFERISWNHASRAVDPDDMRWILPGWDPLGASEWYRDQAPNRRSLIGLHRVAGLFAVGIEFEAVLARGLLGLVDVIPAGHPGARFAYQEIADEAKHSMMFREFVDRSGAEPTPSDGSAERYDRVARLGSTHPALFLLSAISGEAAFDLLQRKALKDWPNVHPLLADVNRAHCEDERRHISFARAMLSELVPTLSSASSRALRYQAPVAVRWTVTQMIRLPDWMRTLHGIPDQVARALAVAPEASGLEASSLAPTVSLCRQLGVATERLSTLWGSTTTSRSELK